MKVLTKILNILLVVLVLSGILFPILYFNSIKVNKNQYEQLLSKNTQLTEQIVRNKNSLKVLKDSLIIKDAEIAWSTEKVSEQNEYIKSLEAQLVDDLHKLTNMSLEEVLDYILNYYGTDKAQLITYDNEIQVVIQEPLVREWSSTITKLESCAIKIVGYEDQISNYELLTCTLEDKINILEQRDSLFQSSLDASTEQNSVLQNLLDDRNRRIKSIKLQRNIIGGVCVVILIIALI